MMPSKPPTHAPSVYESQFGTHETRGLPAYPLSSGVPVIARRIIEERPYRSVDDLKRVKGIGRKWLAEIRPLVTVE